jgi:hypothetical protein
MNAAPLNKRGVKSYPQNLLLRGKRNTLSDLDPVSTSLTTSSDIVETSPARQDAGRGRRCDYCGYPPRPIELLHPWNWPPDCPTRTVYLHTRCEGPWHDSDTASIAPDKPVSR